MYSGKVADYDPVTGFFVSTTMTMIPKTSTSSESLLSLYHLSNRDLCISAHISRPRQADQRPSSTSYCRDVDRDMNDMRAESTADYRGGRGLSTDQRPSSTSYRRDVDRDMNDMRAESTADYRGSRGLSIPAPTMSHGSSTMPHGSSTMSHGSSTVQGPHHIA